MKHKLPASRPGIKQVIKHRTLLEKARDRKVRALLEQEKKGILSHAQSARQSILWAMQLTQEKQRQGLSLTELASSSGMQRASLQKLLAGQVPNPKLSTIRRIADSLGLSCELRIIRRKRS